MINKLFDLEAHYEETFDIINDWKSMLGIDLVFDEERYCLDTESVWTVEDIIEELVDDNISEYWRYVKYDIQETDLFFFKHLTEKKSLDIDRFVYKQMEEGVHYTKTVNAILTGRI